NGGRDEVLQSAVLGSDAYVQIRGGGTDSGFLMALYQDVLGRPIDAAGQSFFTDLLSRGVSHQAVALDVITSDEGLHHAIDGWYRQYLRRPADSAGLGSWTAALHSGGRDEQVVAALVASDEYLLRLTESHPDAVLNWES